MNLDDVIVIAKNAGFTVISVMNGIAILRSMKHEYDVQISVIREYIYFRYLDNGKVVLKKAKTLTPETVRDILLKKGVEAI